MSTDKTLSVKQPGIYHGATIIISAEGTSGGESLEIGEGDYSRNTGAAE